jgi:GNAT superfamily N-acetyltransferase
MLEYNVETLTPDLIREMLPFQEQYHTEVAAPFHSFPPDVDWPTYLIAQQAGKLKVICGRIDGKLKAGTFVVITPHPHYACISASLPLLFVDPEYRRGREGVRLVRMAIEESKKSGAQLMMSHGGVHNDVYKLFEYLGFSDYGRYFVMQIGDTNPVFKDKAWESPH